jgi:FkbM family methyltransferase
MKLRSVSRPFVFHRKGIEFAAGLAWHPDGKRLLISYGIADREAWVATVDAVDVRNVLDGVDRLPSGNRVRNRDVTTCFSVRPKRANGTIVQTTINGANIRFFVTNRDDAIMQFHYQGDFYETEELDIIRRHYTSRGTFADIGANVGNHAIYISRFTKSPRIVVFEPNQATIAILKENLILNQCTNVDVRFLGVALGAGKGRLRQEIADANNLGHTCYYEDDSGDIQRIDGDSLILNEPVEFIKIDVEGMEIEVLSGLQKTIRRWRPTIFVEVWDSKADGFLDWCRHELYEIVERFQRYEGIHNYLVKPQGEVRSTDLNHYDVLTVPTNLPVGSGAVAESVSPQRDGTSTAEGRYTALLSRDPDNRYALRQLSNLYLERGAFEEAVPLIHRLIDHEPNLSDAHNNLGTALLALRRPSDAVRCFERAIELEPNRPEFHHNLGGALQLIGRSAEARACYERAITLRPDYAEAHNSLGVLLAANDPNEAFTCFRRALAASPTYVDAHNNMGNALLDLARCDEAIASYRQALAIRPDHAEAHNNLGMALRELNRHEEALACLEMAQAIKPDYVDAHINEGLVRLALDDYANGWKKYSWRNLKTSFGQGKKRPPRPLWLGNWDISGKTILLCSEEGLGDTVQFCRYVPLVAQRGARVILAVQRPLSTLMAGLQGASVVCDQGEPVPPFDGFCPLLSLPGAFATKLETIPAAVPYLSVEPDAAARWRRRLDGDGGAKVGIVWAGNPQHRNDARRSIAAETLLPLLRVQGARWFSLQVGERAADLARLPHGLVADLSPHLSDFAETAAAIASLDLVICVDTAVAHLAGAMGKPVWVLLPFSADWRWLRYRSDSPWYPTARLFRQPAPGDWPSVVMQVRDLVSRWA